uniref:Palmitoyltransferase n=1 Tax=Naja naja TaxID=35670 RepID=A0A8C6VMF1_NAJNA
MERSNFMMLSENLVNFWCPFHAVAFNLVVLMLLICHTRAVFADPGVVPLPDTALDFSDLRSSNSSNAAHQNSRNNEDWTVCNRCETYRPPRAHHCRICHRCVRRMDHHCPWINNCVGELNQKYFIQFLFYTGLASLYAMGLVLATWVWPLDRISASRSEGYEGGVAGNPIQIAHRIILLVESILFGLFVTVIFYDQVVSIITDESPIEQLRNRLQREGARGGSHTRKPKIALLREVFGRGASVLRDGGPSFLCLCLLFLSFLLLSFLFLLFLLHHLLLPSLLPSPPPPPPPLPLPCLGVEGGTKSLHHHHHHHHHPKKSLLPSSLTQVWSSAGFSPATSPPRPPAGRLTATCPTTTSDLLLARPSLLASVSLLGRGRGTPSPPPQFISCSKRRRPPDEVTPPKLERLAQRPERGAAGWPAGL